MKTILLKNGLHTDMENGNISKKDILIENGKIKNIAENIQYQARDINIIDLKESYVYPGFIDCHTHMGIIEEGVGDWRLAYFSVVLKSTFFEYQLTWNAQWDHNNYTYS